jgi:hypothetical protein
MLNFIRGYVHCSQFTNNTTWLHFYSQNLHEGKRKFLDISVDGLFFSLLLLLLNLCGLLYGARLWVNENSLLANIEWDTNILSGLCLEYCLRSHN